MIDMNIPSLILDLIDAQTSCICHSLEFSGEELNELVELIGIKNIRFDGVSYFIDVEKLAAIKEFFRLKKFPHEAYVGQLRARSYIDDLPYLLHTNRELLLMLQGDKPLTVFHDFHPWESCELLEMYEKFLPYVAEGRFIKREYIDANSLADHQSVRWVFFALPAEAWRIDAYILLVKTAKLSGWNDGFERMEGALLGYTDEQNNIHLAKNSSSN